MKNLLTIKIRMFPLLTSFLFGFSIAFTIYNRFANTYFWNRSGKVQLFLLITLSSLLAILLYLAIYHLLPKSQFRPITRRFVVVVFSLSLIWVALPLMSGIYKGEVRTPEHLLLQKHQLQLIATGEKHPSSTGSEIRLKHIEVKNNEGRDLIINLMDKSGEWTDQNQEWVTASKRSASLNYDFLAMGGESQLKLLFAVSPYSGKVIVRLDGEEKLLDLFEAQEGETLLSILIPSSSMGIFWTLFLRLLEAISITTIFRLGVKKKIFIILLICYSLFLLQTILKTPPQKHGDGYEYLYTTQAFQNHASPNPLDSDIPFVKAILSQNRIRIPGDIPNHLESKSGLRFSAHFWFYSLIVVPAKVFLEKLGLNGLLSFQLTNTILFLISLWCLVLYGHLGDRQIRLLTAFLAVNPVLWYLLWWTPEVFTYSFVVLSLTFFSRRNYKTAAFFAAIASMQNQPIIFLAGYFIFLDLCQYWPKITMFHLIKSALPTTPMFLPPLFYYLYYGTPSLIISGGSGLKLISAAKFTDFFLDLNMGLFPYTPILLLLFVMVFAKSVYIQNILDVLFGCTLFILVLSATQMGNWNSDCTGLMRYGVWVIPIMAVYTVRGLKWDGFWRGVWSGGIVYQLFVIMFFGGISAKINYVQMTPFAQVILDHFPQLYSPEKETFMERANHMERSGGYDFPFSYYASKNGEIKKILTDYENFKKFRALENIAIEVKDGDALDKAGLFLANKEGLHYLNFPNDEIEIINETKLTQTFIH